MGISGNLFAYHPKPLPDELLTSWLLRIAHGNGLKAHPFCSLYFDRREQIWNRDFDKCVNESFLAAIARYSGMTLQQAQGTTLRAYEGLLYESHNPFGNTKWILPLGVYHRTQRRNGVQFCPLCLATDPVPYFRRRWRLAFYTTCDLHSTLMQDCCPGCQSPVSFFRSELGDRNKYPGASLRHCFKCGYDLGHAPVTHNNWHSWEMLVNHQSLMTWFDLGWSFATGGIQQYSHLYFEGLHQICKLLLMKDRLPRIGEFRMALQQKTGLKWHSENRARPFETQDIFVRHQIIGNAVWLTQDWPNRFLQLARAADLRYSEIVKDLYTKPFWFTDPIEHYMKQHLGPNKFKSLLHQRLSGL